jgi:hypothetical protein
MHPAITSHVVYELGRLQRLFVFDHQVPPEAALPTSSPLASTSNDALCVKQLLKTYDVSVYPSAQSNPLHKLLLARVPQQSLVYRPSALPQLGESGVGIELSFVESALSSSSSSSMMNISQQFSWSMLDASIGALQQRLTFCASHITSLASAQQSVSVSLEINRAWLLSQATLALMSQCSEFLFEQHRATFDNNLPSNSHLSALGPRLERAFTVLAFSSLNVLLNLHASTVALSLAIKSGLSLPWNLESLLASVSHCVNIIRVASESNPVEVAIVFDPLLRASAAPLRVEGFDSASKNLAEQFSQIDSDANQQLLASVRSLPPIGLLAASILKLESDWVAVQNQQQSGLGASDASCSLTEPSLSDPTSMQHPYRNTLGLLETALNLFPVAHRLLFLLQGSIVTPSLPSSGVQSLLSFVTYDVLQQHTHWAWPAFMPTHLIKSARLALSSHVHTLLKQSIAASEAIVPSDFAFPSVLFQSAWNLNPSALASSSDQLLSASTSCSLLAFLHRAFTNSNDVGAFRLSLLSQLSQILLNRLQAVADQKSSALLSAPISATHLHATKSWSAFVTSSSQV